LQNIVSFYRALLQKRPVILCSLLIEATPYQLHELEHWQSNTSTHYDTKCGYMHYMTVTKRRVATPKTDNTKIRSSRIFFLRCSGGPAIRSALDVRIHDVKIHVLTQLRHHAPGASQLRRRPPCDHKPIFVSAFFHLLCV